MNSRSAACNLQHKPRKLHSQGKDTHITDAAGEAGNQQHSSNAAALLSALALYPPLLHFYCSALSSRSMMSSRISSSRVCGLPRLTVLLEVELAGKPARSGLPALSLGLGSKKQTLTVSDIEGADFFTVHKVLE